MSARTANIVFSRWKVFADGVEIPHQGLSCSYAVDMPSMLQVFLEPDPAFQRFRPDTLIHVFHRDPFPDDPTLSDEELYQLVYEGVVTGLQFQKTPTARFVTLEATGLIGYLAKSKAFMMGVGLLPWSTILTGSTLINFDVTPGLTSTDILSFSTMSDQLTDSKMTGTFVENRDQSAPSMASRLTRLIHELCSYNAVLRQQVARSRLLDKIAGVSDEMLDGLFGLSTLSKMMGQPQSSLGEDSTAYDIVRHMMSYSFYHITDIPRPHRPAEQPGEGERHRRLNVDSPRIPKQHYRNDTVILPETYYTLPPPCNIVLPDTLMELSVQRDFSSERTRHIIIDPFAGYAVAAPKLVQDANGSSPSAFLGIPTKQTADSSPYGTVEQNLLFPFTDRELEKGIVPTLSTSNFEAFAATAFVNRSVADTLPGKQSAINAGLSDGRNLEMTEVMTSMANFQLTLLKFKRRGTATLVGHHFLVPGFPALVCDKDMPYLGNVQQLTLAVTPEGQESTTVMFSKMRPVPEVSEVASVDDILSTISEASGVVTDMATAISEATVEDYVPKYSQNLTNAIDLVNQTLSALNSVDSSWRTILADHRFDDSTINPEAGAKPNEKLLSILRDYNYQVDTAQTLELPWMTVVNKAGLTLQGKPASVFQISQGTIGAASLLGQIRDAVVKVNEDLSGLAGINSVVLSTILTNSQGNLRFLVDRGDFQEGDNAGSFDRILPHLDNITRNNDKVLSPTTISFDFQFFVRDLQQASAGGGTGSYVSPDYGLTTPGTAGGLSLALSNTILMLTELGTSLGMVEVTYSNSVLDQATQDEKLAVAQKQVSAEFIDKIFDKFREIEDQLDIPSPPPFFAESLSNTTKLDELYSSLLGCSAFYSSGEYAETATAEAGSITQSLNQLAGNATDAVKKRIDQLQKQIDFYFQYVQGLKSLTKLYPVTGLLDNVEASEKTWDSWADRTNSAGLAGATRWAYNNFQRRKGVSLQQFAEDNLLEVIRQTSTSTEPHTFLQLRPVKGITTELVHNDGQTYSWDNTIFSKIVDENELASGEVNTSDLVIAAIRRRITDKYLTTGPRQELVLEYSRRHFGSRGQDGT